MTPLFWISLTWVLATVGVSRMPLHQRYMPGAGLVLCAIPIILSIGFQVGWFMALLGVIAMLSLFPNPVRMLQAHYRGEEVQINALAMRYLVIPGDV